MKDKKGLYLFEQAMLLYAAFTLVLMLVLWSRLPNPLPMLTLRVVAVAATVALWQLYRWRPCKFTALLRVVFQLVLLGSWYPDTYETNRIFLNLDHIFADWEQALFGCQPALLFSQQCTSPVVSELLCMGYVSYYPMIGAVAAYYFFKTYERMPYALFVILGAFFLFYVIFIFLPVAGPQYYYEAVGTGQIAQGSFPDLGHYFQTHQTSLATPGADGLFHQLVQQAHVAGERPTAAFPSSHVGIAVVLLWLARESRSRWLFFSLLPLCVLMFFATFYIQAHYAIDAIAGLIVGTLMYFVLRHIYRIITNKTSLI